ncbi:MAG: hypothetical protein ABW046_15065, partial [Actinoplanes sp.]
TGAYLASRIAAETVAGCLGPDADVEGLCAELGRALRDAAAALPPTSGSLRSSIHRPLPTTAAILRVVAADEVRRRPAFRCRAIWAGDSRVFALKPGPGLVQLTRDHLREEVDPFENLTADSPMSNYLSADGRFHLAEAASVVEGPFAGIAATDGCFGYVESPILFEWMLLDTLAQATDPDDWNVRLQTAIGTVTGDDASAAVGLFGWPSFPALQSAFRARTRQVRREVDELEAARAGVRRAEQELDRRRRQVWARYRRDYEGYRS